MGFVAKIKLLFKMKKPIGNLIEEATNVKSGWKTTEFYLTILSNLITIAGALNGIIDPKTAAIVLAVLNGLYTTLRTIAKSGTTETPKQ